MGGGRGCKPRTGVSWCLLSPYIPLPRFKRKTCACPYLSACRAEHSLWQRSRATLWCHSSFPPNVRSHARRARPLLAPRFPCPSRRGRCSHTHPLSSTLFIFPHGLTYTSFFFFFSFCNKLHLGSARVAQASAQRGAWSSFPHTFPSGWPPCVGKTLR